MIIVVRISLLFRVMFFSYGPHCRSLELLSTSPVTSPAEYDTILVFNVQ